MTSRTINYQADGLNMAGEFFEAQSDAATCPGVLVFPEAFGLGEHAKSKAAKIAELGYHALACDLHGDASIVPFSEVGAVLGPLFQDRGKVVARTTGAMEALLAQPGVDASAIAAIGYCFGGAMAIELGCTGADLKAIVAFHSGLGSIDQDALGGIRGRLLMCQGADDPGIPADQLAAFEASLNKGGVAWDLHLYGGVVHSFTNPEADALGNEALRYDKRADRHSFDAMVRLFKEELGA